MRLTFERRGDEFVVHQAKGRVNGKRASACKYQLQLIDLMRVENPEAVPPQPNGDSLPHLVFCNGEYLRTIWVGPHNTVDPAVSGRSVAERLVREVGVPEISVGINPTEGLAGLDSWFWVEGYDGRPISRQVSGFGLNVELRIERGQVRWDFGDGTPPVTGDLGRAYPARSSIRHVYTVRSVDGPFRVTARFDLAPQFRVNGGPWQSLPPIARTASAGYTVREVQAVID